VVTKPQNVLVMRDVACAGYVAGCNTQWFARDYGGTDKAMSLDKAQTNMMNRLSFGDDVGAKYSSMLAFPCWADQFESGHLDTVMSITTRLLPWEVTSASGGTHSSFPGGARAYDAYSKALNLRSVHFGEDMKAAENQEFISQVSTPCRAFKTPKRLYSFCALPSVVCTGLDQQRDVLHWPVAQVRPLYQVVHVARAGPGPLWPRRHSWGARCKKNQTHASTARVFWGDGGRRMVAYVWFFFLVAGRAVAPRRERQPEDGARCDGGPGAGAARADGLHQEVDSNNAHTLWGMVFLGKQQHQPAAVHILLHTHTLSLACSHTRVPYCMSLHTILS
jgi:hypothetical protein